MWQGMEVTQTLQGTQASRGAKPLRGLHTLTGCLHMWAPCDFVSVLRWWLVLVRLITLICAPTAAVSLCSCVDFTVGGALGRAGAGWQPAAPCPAFCPLLLLGAGGGHHRPELSLSLSEPRHRSSSGCQSLNFFFQIAFGCRN